MVQDVEDDSHTELITNGVVLDFRVLQVHDFGSNKARSSASTEEVFIHVQECCETEVGDTNILLSHLIGSKEDIFRLQVPVHHPTLMAMGNCLQNRPDESGRLLF